MAPSVIVLTELLKHQTSPDQLIQKIYSLQVGLVSFFMRLYVANDTANFHYKW